MFYKYFVLDIFETQNCAPICVTRKRSGHVLLRCTLGMSNKQFIFADGIVFPGIKRALKRAVYGI